MIQTNSAPLPLGPKIYQDRHTSLGKSHQAEYITGENGQGCGEQDAHTDTEIYCNLWSFAQEAFIVFHTVFTC